MWAIFQEPGNSPVVMHLLKSSDNHSDTVQLAIFKNLDGMSLGELPQTNHPKSAQNSEKSSYYQLVLTEELLRTFFFCHNSRQSSK